MSKLKIAIVSLDIAWADRDENLSKVKEALKLLPYDTDIVVLPELFSTGFVVDTATISNIAETNNGNTVKTLCELAYQHRVAIAGSFLAGDGDNYFNRGFFIEPSGENVFYDKAHLFSLSQENKIYNHGCRHYPVVRFRGWNIALVICFDLRFPAWCRAINSNYDIMLVPANWPQSRKYAWEHLLIARAIENQAIYVGADRSGSDDFGTYDNMSLIFDGLGKPIAMKHLHNDNHSLNITIAEVDKEHLEESRTKLPFQSDSDTFQFC